MKRPTITAAMKLECLRQHYATVRCSMCISEMWERAPDLDLNQIEFDHHLALIDGGQHTVDNLRPLCYEHHAKKSAREHIANCKAKRLKAGPKKSKHPLKSRGFNKTKSRPFGRIDKPFSRKVVER